MNNFRRLLGEKRATKIVSVFFSYFLSPDETLHMFYGIVRNFIRHLQQLHIELIHFEREIKAEKDFFCNIRIIKKRYFNKIYCLLSRVSSLTFHTFFSLAALFGLVHMHKCINDNRWRTSSTVENITVALLNSDNIVQSVQLIVFFFGVSCAEKCLLAFSSGLVKEQSEIICPAGLNFIARQNRAVDENLLVVYLDFFKNFGVGSVAVKGQRAKLNDLLKI